MSTELFAPFPLMSGATANIINPATGGVYTLSARGSVFVADTDVPYFLTQGYIVAHGGGGGGGGGGGIGIAATLAILAATPASTGAVLLTDPIRGGPFVWSGANHSVDVANDPGQGVTVASSSDPTGALGAWIRQYPGTQVVGSWWGYLPDATPTVDPWMNNLFTQTANGTTGTPQLTGLASTATMVPGMTVRGTGVPGNALILTVNSSSQVTLTVNLTANIIGGTISFSGPVPGTGTDNSISFINIGKWGRGQGNLDIRFPKGTALWNGSVVNGSDPSPFYNTACYWASGIKDLIIEGPGAIWQNTYNDSISGNNSAAHVPLPITDILQIKGYLIANTVIGSNFFTLLNLSDVAASGIAPGMDIAIGCNDSQTLGYPPNPGQYEFLRITSIVGTQVNVFEAIKYIHRTDFADYNTTPGISSTCGAARMWVMPDPAWQGKLHIKRLTCNLSPGLTQGPYASVVKRQVITEGYEGPGFSESFCRYVDHIDLVPHTSGETDKFVDQIIYRNAQGPGNGFAFQSATPNRLIFEGGNLAGMTGVGKQTLIRGAKMDQFKVASQFGMNTSTILEGCDITVAPGTSMGNLIDGAQLQTIDGTNASWANGFITLLCGPLAVNGQLPHWNVAPGMWVNLQNNFSVPSGSIGTGMVLSQTWNPAIPSITIETTLKQYATLPTWASGKIWLFKCNELIFRNCIGADEVRQASAANNAGQRYFEYKTVQFGGINGQNLNPIGIPFGCELIEVDVNVITASSVANAVLTLIITTYQNPANPSSLFVGDAGSGTVIVIRLDIAGRRKITQTEFTGYPTGTGTLDHITVNNVASDFLGTNRIVGPTGALQFFSQAGSTAASPVGEVIMKFNAGMIRTPLTRQWDDSGTMTLAHEFIGMQGSLP